MNHHNRTQKFDVFSIDYALLSRIREHRERGEYIPPKQRQLKVKTVYPKES